MTMDDKPKKTRSLNQPDTFESTYDEVKVETPVMEKAPVKQAPAPEPPKPKKYICRVRCWVSSKCEMFNPGDVTEFAEGEFIPSHFEPVA